jgi:hypothetical protein
VDKLRRAGLWFVVRNGPFIHGVRLMLPGWFRKKQVVKAAGDTTVSTIKRDTRVALPPPFFSLPHLVSSGLIAAVQILQLEPPPFSLLLLLYRSSLLSPLSFSRLD